ncbi:XRE family transcriptional regulator [Actinomadura sp. 9N407]|uniref:XRE family transcriptional regulator n=1 Tax=Actinomadura sp. 9N407 TaxID=3375154 RepID=UPI00378F536B
MNKVDTSKIVGARLQAARKAPPYWPRNEMARLLRTAADLLGLPAFPHVGVLADMIKQWERGDHIPSHKYRHAYCEVLGRAEPELFAPEAEEASVDDATTAPMGTVNPSPIPDDGDDDVKRRAALQMLAALGAGTTIPPGALEEVLSGVERALGQSVDISEWERAVREYGCLISRQPVGTLINDLTADIVAVGELLNREGAGSRTELLRVSAGLSALLAIEIGDVGNRRGARLAWRTAHRAADASGDRDLRVWVRAREAEEAFWAGLPPADIRSATTAAMRIADGVPCPGLPRAYSVHASLAAESGDASTAHETMNMVSEVFEGLPESMRDDPSTFGWGEARLRWNEAYIFTLTRNPRAERAVSDALALYPSGTVGPVANLQTIRAMGLIKAREVDAGLDQALTTLHDHPISPARRRIAGQILQALPEKARSLPAAREVRAVTAGV